MKFLGAGALVISAMLTMDASGAVTTTVVDVPSGAVTQRFLYLRPASPQANLVALPGGDGILGIQDDGTMTTSVSDCTPVARNRQAFADHGVAVALVDADSAGVVHDFNDVREVIRYMQARDNVPTWLIGGSSSTKAIATIANGLPAENPVGVIFFSPSLVPATNAAMITRPTLIVYHPADPYQFAAELFPALTSAPVKEQVALAGGSDVGCGFHLFNGQDAEFVAATTGFIDRNNSGFSSSNVLVVEYHHLSFDHYFITPVAAEITLLDAHAHPFEEWSRTGFSFKAYANVNAPAGSVAICRFFNSSFAPKSSHFYAPHGLGCETTIAGFPDWILEDDKLFNTMLPDTTSGTCPAGTIPVYRLYNNGMGAAPNHRFLTDLAERQKMLAKGYIAEGAGIGVGMCVPGP